MSNSPLVSYTKLSPNHSGRRNHVIDTISIHCMAGNGSVETCGALFADPARKASSNYGIGSDGRIALYVRRPTGPGVPPMPPTTIGPSPLRWPTTAGRRTGRCQTRPTPHCWTY
ncbi:MAG: N-acetylmuramoyl-L-alanine amidase [Evtepia gabavorous]